jgi:2-polyprenyl-6-methoxyphenol hydroxylase-like FAD-dependent oxidoreductase
VLLRGSTNKILEVDLSQLRDATEFPFSLLIPQHEVERIFRERLASQGIHIFRNQTAVGLRQNDHGGVDVSFEDGSVINTQYIVGADGSRSMVRDISLFHAVQAPQRLPCCRYAMLWVSNL